MVAYPPMAAECTSNTTTPRPPQRRDSPNAGVRSEYAAALYDALHQADTGDYTWIAVDLPPNAPNGKLSTTAFAAPPRVFEKKRLPRAAVTSVIWVPADKAL